MKQWIADELSACSLPDRRLHKRLEVLLEQLSKQTGKTIPMACQDWANTKAAYRFIDNDRVSEDQILQGHFQSTHSRFSATTGPLLILHDTTEFSYRRKTPSDIGVTHKSYVGKHNDGRPKLLTVCGLMMHASMVVTPMGLPLGLAAVKFWTRKKFKGVNRLNKKVNATRMPIEKKESFRWIENLKLSTELLSAPERCVHVGDREADIYELFCAAQEMGTHCLIRTCVDRLAEDGTLTINQVMKNERVKAVHQVEVRDARGVVSKATLELRYCRIQVLPPIGKRKRYPRLTLNVLFAQERDAPAGREPLNWNLITDLPIDRKVDAIEKLDWYATRWKIESYFKIVKSGCKAEELKLRSAARLTNLIAVFCILSWRIFWLTMLQRICPKAKATLALSEKEIEILNKVVLKKAGRSIERNVAACVTMVARLGGYLARSSDGPPGSMVLWRGMTRLTDIALGFTMRESCG